MRPIATLTPELINSGLHPSLPPNVSPLWQDGRNVIFRDGGVRPEVGQSVYFKRTEKAPVRGMLELRQDLHRKLYYGTNTKLFKYDPETLVVTPLGSGYSGVLHEQPDLPAHRWAMVAWGDWVIASSAHQQILIDKNNGAGFVPLAGTPIPIFKPEILVKYGPHLIAFNHNDGQAGHVTMWWCTDNNPEIWAPAADNSAGSQPLHDAPSSIRAALRFGNGIVAITDDTLHGINYVGDPYYFGIGGRIEGIGAVSKHSVLEANGLLFGFGPRGIWSSDGNGVEYIDHPSVKNYIYDDLNKEQLSQIHGWHDVPRERIVWWWCSKRSMVLDRAIGIHYKSGLWHIPEFMREASSNQDVFPYPLVGDADGNIYVVGIAEGLPPQPTAPITLQAEARIHGSAFGYGLGGYGGNGYGGVGITVG